MSDPPACPCVVTELCADISVRQRLKATRRSRTMALWDDEMLTSEYEQSLDIAAYLKAEIIRRRGK